MGKKTMDSKILSVFLLVLLCTVNCQPLEKSNYVGDSSYSNAPLLRHSWRKRFIDPSLTYGDFSDNIMGKIRTKRSFEEECEKLQLCLLHARSSHSFLAAFQLYFVNKENAKLWDHQARSRADCENRFSCYR